MLLIFIINSQAQVKSLEILAEPKASRLKTHKSTSEGLHFGVGGRLSAPVSYSLLEFMDLEIQPGLTFGAGNEVIIKGEVNILSDNQLKVIAKESIVIENGFYVEPGAEVEFSIDNSIF